MIAHFEGLVAFEGTETGGKIPAVTSSAGAAAAVAAAAVVVVAEESSAVVVHQGLEGLVNAVMAEDQDLEAVVLGVEVSVGVEDLLVAEQPVLVGVLLVEEVFVVQEWESESEQAEPGAAVHEQSGWEMSRFAEPGPSY